MESKLTYQPSLYSFPQISTSRSRRKVFCLFSKISASVIGGAARFTASMRGPPIRNQRDAGGGSGICMKVLVKYSTSRISGDLLLDCSELKDWINQRVEDESSKIFRV